MVLALAVAMPWVALHVPLGAALALADSSSPPTRVGAPSGIRAMDGISWSTSGSLVVPALPTTPQNPESKHRDLIRYVAHAGDTLRGLASQFSLSVNTMIWSNPGAVDRLTEGEVVEIPPVDGVLVRVAAGDTVAALAQKYRAEADAIQQIESLTAQLRGHLLAEPEDLREREILVVIRKLAKLWIEARRVAEPYRRARHHAIGDRAQGSRPRAGVSEQRAHRS